MRAADDFATIRDRMQQLEREREWRFRQGEQVARNEGRSPTDFGVVQRVKDEMKARIIVRDRG